MEYRSTMNARYRGLALCLLIWLMMTSLVGCGEEGTVTATASPGSVSPLESPLVAVSPVDTPVPIPADVPTPESLLGAGFDPAQAVLAAEDMGDLFGGTTYSISQPYERDGVRGIQVTHPTLFIEHTTAFAEGFATQIEVFDDFDDLVTMYYTTVANQEGEPFKMASQGDELSAFKAPSDTPGVDSYSYVVIMRKANALAIITVKTPERVQVSVLERAAEAVAGRLSP